MLCPNSIKGAWLLPLLACLLSVYRLPAQSPVDRSRRAETIRDDFGLADGAAWHNNNLIVPDVKGKKLFAYRPAAQDPTWRVLVENQGGFSGTFSQLGQLYLADNPGGRILKMHGKDVQGWAAFSDGARPNDLVVDCYGNAYVTLTKQGEIRRIQPDGSITTVATGIETPNGITLSPDGRRLYVSAYRPGLVLTAQVTDGRLGRLREFAKLPADEKGGLADGMCIDRAGNVYCAGAASVWIWNPAGKVLDQINTPERPINCAFGGRHGQDLYISTFGGVVRQPMRVSGPAPNPPMKGPLSKPEGRPSTRIPENVDAQLNVSYYQVGDRSLLCDIFSPAKSHTMRPGIVLVHGGGWLHGDKNRFRPLALMLAERGYVVMAIEYRLGHEAHFPAAIQDCNAAVRYLRQNVTQYAIDPKRIVGVGGSAGGHLVGLMATGSAEPGLQPRGRITGSGESEVSSKLNAAVVMAGPMQMATGSVAERSTTGKVSNATHWLGKSIDEAPELYQQADAYEKIDSGTPPMLFITGSLDNPQRDEPSLERLKSVDVMTRQIVHQGAQHGHWNQAEWMERVVQDIQAFLDEALAN